MKRTTSRAGTEPTAGTLRGPLPVLLLGLLVLGLAVPSGIAVAPALLGLDGAAGASAAPWQRVPTRLSGPDAGSRTLMPLSEAAPVPAPAVLTAALDATLRSDDGGSFSGVVQDALTGEVLFDRGGDQARVPASNMKLFTAGAALRVLGPGHRFTTQVLSGPTANSVVLRGGGDVLLAPGESSPGAVLGHAGLGSLAQEAVRALQAEGVTGPVAVLLDDSLFTGAALSPAWNPEDVAAGQIAPLYPLALNGARFDPAKTSGPRPTDAAMTAAEAFAAQFAASAGAAGLTVTPGVVRAPAPTGPETGPTNRSEGRAPADPRVLAEVVSAPVGEQVALMLRSSDNYLAEVLGRMTAIAGGGPGSNEGATAAVQAQVPELAPDAGALGAADVSGLALGNQVTARQLAGVVREMTTGPDPRLREALAGFPVAGLTGTLGDRYLDGTPAAAAGLVRAKTGTLNTVMALSGYVVDADGRLLVFAFVGNSVSPGLENKAALDRSAAVLAGCGCR